jgi:hypothetical protein
MRQWESVVVEEGPLEELCVCVCVCVCVCICSY